MGEMEQSVEITKELEERAAALGASAWTIAKWRARGIPAKWQIRLFGLKAPTVPTTQRAPAPAQAGEAVE
jgi:hypothetical protein